MNCHQRLGGRCGFKNLLLIGSLIGSTYCTWSQEEDKGWSGPDTSDGFDWIELTSGEWLKGDLKTMYDGKMEFDSDELDLLNLDWEDVRQVTTKRTHTVRSEDKLEYSGSLYINENKVKIVNQEGSTEVFERDHLMTIVEGSPKEINYWSFKFSIGLAVQQGNTDQADFNVSARIKRQTTANRLNLDFLGLISEVNGVETANNHRANASFDIFLSRRFFLRPVFAEYYHDPFVNIDHRGTLGVALGYHIIDTSRTEWDVFGGPAYQYTKFVSVQPGASSDAQTAAFIAGTKYDIELTGWLDLYAGYNFSLLNQASGTYTHHAVAGVEVELTDILDLDFGIVWDRVQNPQQRADGSTPKSNDFRMTLGLGLDI